MGGGWPFFLLMKPKSLLRRAVQGILLLDKPLGLSSNAALQQVKRLFRAEKAGHTGSLDPLATGLLPICFGQATKLSGHLLDSDKRYRTVVRLGERTRTGDAEGEVIKRSDPAVLTRHTLEIVLARFTGPITQVPPMYSALKHEGRPLYELARKGVEIEREARQVQIHSLQLLGFGSGEFELDVRCSKGTYIRTLAEDIAAAAGQCAHLKSLRRLEAGPFLESGMHSLERIEAAAGEGEAALDRLLLGAETALAGWSFVTVDDVRAQRLRQGMSQLVAGAPRQAMVAVQDAQGHLLCLAETDGAGTLAPRRWLAA